MALRVPEHRSLARSGTVASSCTNITHDEDAEKSTESAVTREETLKAESQMSTIPVFDGEGESAIPEDKKVRVF